MMRLLIGAIALAAASAVATAGAKDQPAHADRQDAAIDFVRTELAVPASVRIATSGEPFPASAMIDGAEWTGLAVTTRVWMHLGPRNQPVMRRYTVLIMGDETFALRRDVKKFKRLRHSPD